MLFWPRSLAFQDPLGKQGFCVFGCDGNLRVWARQLQGLAEVHALLPCLLPSLC